MWYLRHLGWWWCKRRMLAFAFRFSLPLVATNLLMMGQSRVGRYVLSFAGFGSGLGLYGVAQRFAQNYGAAVRPTKIVALRILGHALEEDAESPSFLRFFHLFACLALCAAFLVALFLGDLIKLLVAPAYHGAIAALLPLVFCLYLQELYTLYHSLMFRHFKVWFHLIGSLISFPVVVAITILLVRPLGFFGAAVAELIGALAVLGYAHWYASRLTQQTFQFGEKLLFTVAAYALVALAQSLGLSLMARVALAMGALIPYLLFHWQRRGALLGGVAEVQGIP
jgi:O-antigen/teichoic acid export membrane protein